MNKDRVLKIIYSRTHLILSTTTVSFVPFILNFLVWTYNSKNILLVSMHNYLKDNIAIYVFMTIINYQKSVEWTRLLSQLWVKKNVSKLYTRGHSLRPLLELMQPLPDPVLVDAEFRAMDPSGGHLSNMSSYFNRCPHVLIAH